MGCCRSERAQKGEFIEIQSRGFGMTPEGGIISPAVVSKVIKAQSLFRGFMGRQKAKDMKKSKIPKHITYSNSQPLDNNMNQEEERKQIEISPGEFLKGFEGEVPQGTFVSYDKEGMWKGKFNWKDGSTYNGQFRDSSINGIGIYTWSDGRKYSGSWVKNKMQGSGRFTWPDGRIYEGEYWEDKKQGEGVFTWPEGRKYIGSWMNGMQHGQGVLVGSKGNQRRGQWNQGRLVTWVNDTQDTL